MSHNFYNDLNIPSAHPVLRRSYKATCIFCNSITTAHNIDREGAICSKCVPYLVQKDSVDIIINSYKNFTEKRQKNL